MSECCLCVYHLRYWAWSVRVIDIHHPYMSTWTLYYHRQELLQLLAETCLLPVDADLASSCIQPIFDHLLVSVLWGGGGVGPCLLLQFLHISQHACTLHVHCMNLISKCCFFSLSLPACLPVCVHLSVF